LQSSNGTRFENTVNYFINTKVDVREGTVVSVSPTDPMISACSTTVREGMNIWTNTAPVTTNIREVIKEMLAIHPLQCKDCIVKGKCEFQKIKARYNVMTKELSKEAQEALKIRTAEAAKMMTDEEMAKFEEFGSHAIRLDRTKCIKCTRCIRVCSEIQQMNVLGMTWDKDPQVTCYAAGEKFDLTQCIGCGQCAYICPVSGITVRSNIAQVRELLKNKKNEKGEDIVLVAHTAPAIHVAFSEGYGLEPGTLTDNQIVGAFKKIGFDYVFDTNFAADFTIVEEGSELIDRLNKGGPFPMFTSCCPAWINLVEKVYPELIPHLSSCKSPQGMMGTLVKKYFSKKIGVKPENVKVISIMPCTAKKDEARRPQLNNDTDYVLTTQEAVLLCKLNRLNKPEQLGDAPYDNPLGLSTGSGMLFAASGGVMEAALRTAYEFITKEKFPTLEFTPVRGLDGVKEATLDVNGTPFHIAVVNQIGNAHALIRDLKSQRKFYHFIEVMSCNGGCIGGGGEPKTDSPEAFQQLLQKRIEAIYKKSREKELQRSHENNLVQQVYDEIFDGKPLSPKAKEYLHTHYTSKREGFNYETEH
jgi:NADP-reducing hydrogenase subunit HndD